MVPTEGVEPPRFHRSLTPARLPVPPRGQSKTTPGRGDPGWSMVLVRNGAPGRDVGDFPASHVDILADVDTYAGDDCEACQDGNPSLNTFDGLHCSSLSC